MGADLLDPAEASADVSAEPAGDSPSLRTSSPRRLSLPLGVVGWLGWLGRLGQPVRLGRTVRLGRLVRSPRIGRRGREVAMVAAGSVVLSALMSWPALANPSRTLPQSLGDPLYFVWQLAWVGHALRTDPGGIWTTNIFHQAPGNLAYTDTILGYAPFSAVFDAVGGMGSALLAYNLLYVLITAMAFAGAYLLGRVLGANIPAALVLAAAYGYAPWRLAHAGHPNVLSTGGIALTFALLARGHGWNLRRGAKRRPPQVRWIIAGWVMACWQLTLGFAVGLVFAWVLGLVMTAAAVIGAWSWLQDPQRWAWRHWTWRMLAADAGGGSAFAVTGALLAAHYAIVVHRFPIANRTQDMIYTYSSWGRSLFLAPKGNWWWSDLQAPWRSGLNSLSEQTLLPGLVVTLLALAGLFWSAWTLRVRITLAALVALVVVFALGTAFPGRGRYTYLLLYDYLPGWSALRTPGRLVLWISLGLGLLAAGFVTWATQAAWRRWAPRQLEAGRSATRSAKVWRRGLVVACFVPALLVLSEGGGAMAHPVVPAQPVALRTLPGPVLVLPTSMTYDFLPMTWSTDGWPVLINGGSAFEPPYQVPMRQQARWFPLRRSVSDLRGMGVRTVVLDRSQVAGTVWEHLASKTFLQVEGLAANYGMTVQKYGSAYVFDLRPG